MKMTRIWEILDKFKHLCKRHGWKTSESEDWVEINKGYHNFLWTKNVHPSSFKRLISNRKCIIQEGLSYRIVEPTCTAWLFSETPPEDLVRSVAENPSFSSKIALYDLSQLLERKKTCVRLNNTGSPVFQEFENFLQTEFKVKLEPLPLSFDTKISADNCAIPELA
jgi:hypothetical protein